MMFLLFLLFLLKIFMVFVLVSIGEWYNHKYLLHGRWVYKHIKWLRFSYNDHHIEHHGHGHNDLRPHIDLTPKDYWIAFPFFGFAAWRFFALGQVGGLSGMIALFGVCFVHWLLWNKTHRAIHGLEPNNWATKMPWYPFLRDQHLAHHIRTTTNYGVIYAPWLDLIMGTYWRPSR